MPIASEPGDGAFVVLITGCSSGIGAPAAQRLQTVYATARNVDVLEGTVAVGCRGLALDVTDEESMRRAVC